MAHSKNRVDKAGQTVAERLTAIVNRPETSATKVTRSDLTEALEVIEWWRRSHSRPLSRVAANLRYYAAEQGKPVVAQRLKKLPTIASKLLREPKMKLSRMADIGGVRAVIPDQDGAQAVAVRLRKNWTIGRVRDYVAEPKPDGYRALHLINRHRGRLIEVQLRTPLQDTWANAVEVDARLFDFGLKSGSGPEPLRDYYIALSELFAVVDQGSRPTPELLDRVKALQADADTFRMQRGASK